MRCFPSLIRTYEEIFRHIGCLRDGTLDFSGQYMKLGLVITLNAMKTSWSFFSWRGLLNKFHFDTTRFIERQMQVLSTDIYRGWNAQTLKALFDYEFKPVREYGKDYSHCHHPLLAFRFKEIWWCKNVEKIKRGLTPDRQPKKIVWVESEDSFEDYSAHIVDEELINTLDPHFSNPHALEPDQYHDLPSKSLLEDEDQSFQHYIVDKNGLTTETDPDQNWDEGSAWTTMTEPLC